MSNPVLTLFVWARAEFSFREWYLPNKATLTKIHWPTSFVEKNLRERYQPYFWRHGNSIFDAMFSQILNFLIIFSVNSQNF